MNRLLRLLGWLPVALLPALGADKITATITVTNGTIDGDAITVNSSTRTFKDVVVTAASQIQATNNAARSATNLFQHFAATIPFTGAIIGWGTTTNVMTIAGTTGGSLSVSFSGTWATVTYSTQAVTQLSTVRVPMSGLPEIVRTNDATRLVAGIGSYSQSAFDQNSTAFFTTLMGLANTQTVTGPKTFTGAAIMVSPKFTNAVNYGNAFRSPGSGSGSEQIGTDASASGTESTAVGNGAKATNAYTTALGSGALAYGDSGIAIGFGATAAATAESGMAVGTSATASQPNSMAIGNSSLAAYTNSIAIGYNAAATAANQMVLGGNTHTVKIPGALDVDGGITNSTYYGTLGTMTGGYLSSGGMTNYAMTNITTYQTNVYGGVFRLPRSDLTTLANGANAAVDVGTASNVKIDAGPSAAFGIAGLAGGADGRVLIINNRLAHNFTIYHESGSEPTPANRIYTPTGADVTSTTYAVAMLIYDAEDSRWHLINFQD